MFSPGSPILAPMMRFRFLIQFISLCVGLLPAAVSGAGLTAEQTTFFEKHIRPLLAQHCYQCHSADAKNVKGGLRLDTAAHWQMGGDSGEVIVPGAPEESALFEAVTYENRDLQMPPKYRLKDAEIASLKEWIAMGAPDPREGDGSVAVKETIDIDAGRTFWAFQKVPENAGQGNIDEFIDAKLKSEGLEPVGLADRATLIRRTSFDLTGLPPSPKRINAYLADERSDEEAFGALVDELLDSKAFGERWGRHWLDIVRYAESMGRTRNYPFPYAWRYRDYVIDAFNNDLPYDRFIREQIAGDLLPAKNDKARDRLHVATGFLALGAMDLNERDREQYRMDVVDEQIDVTSRAIMGLTTACARCHDHKFDPIPQTDYYAMAGIFRSSDTFSGYQNRQGGNRAGFYPELLVKLDSVPEEVVAQEDQLVDPKVQQRLKRQEKQLAEVNKQLREAAKLAQRRTPQKRNGKRRGKQVGARLQSPLAEVAPAESPKETLERLRKRQRSLQQAIGKTRRELNQNNNNRKKKFPKVPRTANYAMGVREGGKIDDCQVNIRGEARNLGEKVPRGFLQVLTDHYNGRSEHLSKPKQSGRLELAKWLGSETHPLTARVMVNRLWHHLMGSGLVRTVDNFGEMGERPSHPELLDHLARRFMDEGWSVKGMIREIMLSEAYRRAPDHQEAASAVDPENRLWWRANVRRLQAEPLRDAILAISGQLDRKRPEGSPVMYQPFKDMRRLPTQKNPEWAKKRSVYLPIMRGYVPGFLQAFDFAEPSQVMGRRDVTTVSTQALYFMNSPFLMDQSRWAADRLLTSEVDPKKRLGMAYRLCFGRRPTPEEAEASRAFLQDTEEQLPRERWAGLFQVLFGSAEFRYIR